MVRCEEYDKAKTAACRAEEEGGGSTAKSVEKKKRLEEEARNKVLILNCFFHLLFQHFITVMCGYVALKFHLSGCPLITLDTLYLCTDLID